MSIGPSDYRYSRSQRARFADRASYAELHRLSTTTPVIETTICLLLTEIHDIEKTEDGDRNQCRRGHLAVVQTAHQIKQGRHEGQAPGLAGRAVVGQALDRVPNEGRRYGWKPPADWRRDRQSTTLFYASRFVSGAKLCRGPRQAYRDFASREVVWMREVKA